MRGNGGAASWAKSPSVQGLKHYTMGNSPIGSPESYFWPVCASLDEFDFDPSFTMRQTSLGLTRKRIWGGGRGSRLFPSKMMK